MGFRFLQKSTTLMTLKDVLSFCFLDVVVYWCRFSGVDCNRTADFTQFFDSYYYNCFTYRAPADHVDSDDGPYMYSNLAEGLENGWSAVVLSGSSMLDQNDDEIRTIPGNNTSIIFPA